MINYTVFCFQLECHCTVSKICKIRLIGHFFIYTAELIESVRIKKRNIARFPLSIPEKHRSNAAAGMVRHQLTVNVFPIRFFHFGKHRYDIFLRPVLLLFRCILNGRTGRICCVRRSTLSAASGYSPNANCHQNENQASFHMDVSQNPHFSHTFSARRVPYRQR